MTKSINAQYELEDVMELIDTDEVKRKLTEVEHDYHSQPGAINKARLGIIYHEVALNLSFFSKTEYKGYAKRGLDVLNEMFQAGDTPPDLMPFISSYRASAMSLVSAETKKLRLLGEAFKAFEGAIKDYGQDCYCPEFMRASVSENMPWFFFSKRKHARRDFQSIIEKQEKSSGYANGKIMSFVYWAWARQHQSRRYRRQAISYLNKAIALDPDYKGGRKKAEELKQKLCIKRGILRVELHARSELIG